MINFDYIRTSTAKAAVDAKNKNASSQFIAGGTNLVDLMKKGVTAPEKIIDINGLPSKTNYCRCKRYINWCTGT